ncbi:MAG: coiled-coil domain-containing protein, partial [Myxococcaceae bacterium]
VVAGYEASRDSTDEEPDHRRERSQLFAHSDIKPPEGRAPEPVAAAPQASSARSGTQLFSMSELGLAPEAQAPVGPEPQVLAESPPDEPPAQSRGAKTQLFALADLEREQNAAAPVPFQPIRTGTVLFALSDAQRSALSPGESRPAPPAAAPAPPSAAPRMTQLFGLEPPAAEEPTVVADASHLLVTPKQTPAVFPGPQRTETPMFGLEAVQPPAAAPSPRATQVFGVVTAPPAAAPSPRATQVFGALPGPPAAAPPPRTSPLPPIPRGTMVFGAVTPAAAAAPAGPPSPRMTQLFGLERVEAASPPAAEPPPHSATPLDFPAPDASSTPAEVPAGMVPDYPMFNAPTPLESPADRAERLQQRPPERGSVFPPAPAPLADDPEAEFRAGLKRRNRWAALFGALALLGLGGFAVFKLVVNRRPVPPPAVVAERDTAFALLRRDNGEAKEGAAQRLSELSAKNPQFPDIQAALLIATALQLDDARLEIRRLQTDAEELNKKINRLKEARSPGDWENRVNAMAEQVGALKKASDPLVEEAAALDLEVGKTFRKLTQETAGELSPAEERALVRAQAIYFGVKGGDQATKLAARYTTLMEGGDDGWGSVAFAEYAANARVDAATVRRARTEMEGLRARDSTSCGPTSSPPGWRSPRRTTTPRRARWRRSCSSTPSTRSPRSFWAG